MHRDSKEPVPKVCFSAAVLALVAEDKLIVVVHPQTQESYMSNSKIKHSSLSPSCASGSRGISLIPAESGLELSCEATIAGVLYPVDTELVDTELEAELRVLRVRDSSAVESVSSLSCALITEHETVVVSASFGA